MAKQQPLFSFLFALIAVLMWGSLPIGLQQVLVVMDAKTLVWYRFLVTSFGLLLLLIMRKNLPYQIKTVPTRYLSLILLGVLGLSTNFILFNLALHYIPPTTSQILSPLSSFFMLLAGIFIFKEKITVFQKMGFIALILGLGLFFNDRWQDFAQLNLYFKGVLLGCAASLVWVCYGVSQKFLLARFEPLQILLLISLGCLCLTTPMAHISDIYLLSSTQFAWLIFCGLNTLIAYACYAEALKRWDVAKVSAMTTQIPVFTLIFSELLMLFAPNYFHFAHLNKLSLFGASIVVCGALLSSVGHRIFKRGTK